MDYWNMTMTAGLDYDIIENSRLNMRSIAAFMYSRTLEMFEYKNLPSTVPQEILEGYLQTQGTAFFTKVKGEYYVFFGSFGGEPDPYYRPTIFVVSNPHLGFSKDYVIGDDGILMRNDKLWHGLRDLVSRYASLLGENWLTMKTSDIMLRITSLLSAQDEKTKTSAEIYLNKIKKGEIGIIAETPFFDGIRMQSPPTNNGSYLTQFIELQQYLVGSFFHEIGINANYNMKREAINEGETALNEDSLMPLCDNMLMCRKEDIEKINEKYGLNIEVDFSSSWAKAWKEMQAEVDKKSEEFSQLKLENEMLQQQLEELKTQIERGDENENTDKPADESSETNDERDSKSDSETDRRDDSEGDDEKKTD